MDEVMMAEMAKHGVIHGHKKSKTHPRMRPFIAGNKNEIEFMDPEATSASLQKAVEFLKEIVKKGGVILFVGTHAAAKSAIEAIAKEHKMPYVISRWLGGTLTNFKVINERMNYYVNLRAKKERGELSKYTKREQREFDEEIGKLSENFDGLIALTRLPDAIFIVDPSLHETAVLEARIAHVPIVAVLDTNDDIKGIEYPIVANDHAKLSIDWVVENLKKAFI